MADIVVGIAEMKISNQPEDTLVTYSLGSCMGLSVYDPVARVGGLIHLMLPDSKIEISGSINPCKYVDTGIPLLFKECYKWGCIKHRMMVKIAGCSQILDDHGFFSIGQRNLVATRKLFWKNNVLITAEDVGGTASRTMRLKIDTGEVILSSEAQVSKIL